MGKGCILTVSPGSLAPLRSKGPHAVKPLDTFPLHPRAAELGSLSLPLAWGPGVVQLRFPFTACRAAALEQGVNPALLPKPGQGLTSPPACAPLPLTCRPQH